MRKPLIAGNWKMNNTVTESLMLVTALLHHLKAQSEGVDVVVIPPFTSLYSVGVSLQDSPIDLGAQNIFWEDSGAYTGEISGPFLKELNCDYVLIGHSERREYFGETDETVNNKIFAALRNDLLPIVCVGESLDKREAGEHMNVIEKQITDGLSGIHVRDAEKLTLAYEPVWAIGTGKTASPEQAQEMHAFIRNLIEKMFDAPTASKIRLLYGGSVKGSNAAELLTQKDIDGALVGGAALKGDDFAEIVKAAPKANM